MQKIEAITFDYSTKNISFGQRLILGLILYHLKHNIPITRNDFISLYDKFTKEKSYKGSSENKHSKAQQWFKSNLSRCVLKGLLMVLPIIEVEKERINTLAKIKDSPIQAISFDVYLQSSKIGSNLLLNMLKYHIESNKPITLDAIIELYINRLKKEVEIFNNLPKEIQNHWGFGGCRESVDKLHRFTENQYWKSRYLKNAALSWFQSNLGTCIITGKVITLPIFKIEDIVITNA